MKPEEEYEDEQRYPLYWPDPGLQRQEKATDILNFLSAIDRQLKTVQVGPEENP